MKCIAWFPTPNGSEIQVSYQHSIKCGFKMLFVTEWLTDIFVVSQTISFVLPLFGLTVAPSDWSSTILLLNHSIFHSNIWTAKKHSKTKCSSGKMSSSFHISDTFCLFNQMVQYMYKMVQTFTKWFRHCQISLSWIQACFECSTELNSLCAQSLWMVMGMALSEKLNDLWLHNQRCYYLKSRLLGNTFAAAASRYKPTNHFTDIDRYNTKVFKGVLWTDLNRGLTVSTLYSSLTEHILWFAIIFDKKQGS